MQMPFSFKIISDAGDLRGKKVVLSIDLNVPIQEDKVIDDSSKPDFGSF